MTLPIGFHELNRRFRVYRPTAADDDLGGSDVTDVDKGLAWGKVSQPAGVEQLEAQQASATFSVILHFRPNANVRRGDRLVTVDQHGEPIAVDQWDDLRVKSTVRPSEPVYLRADCEQLQPEGDAG